MTIETIQTLLPMLGTGALILTSLIALNIANRLIDK